MYDTILVATDGSEPANRAVDFALDIASTFDADVHAIYVVDTRRYGASILTNADTAVEDLRERGRELLRDVETRADATSELRRGRPHEEIEAYAAEIDADLVVLGHRGIGAGDEIGSTAEWIVRQLDRPVITA